MSSAPCKAAIVTDQRWARKATNEIVLPIHRVRSIIRVREDERKKIARELHDDLGQEMASLALEMSGTIQQCKFMSLENDMVRAMCQALYEYHSRISHLTARIGEVSHQLHPTVLEHLGLNKALDNLAKEFSNLHNVPVHYTVKDLPSEIHFNVSLCLYRIAQEAFHNIGKHAHATSVEVLLCGYGDEIILTIRDNGIGFSVAPSKPHGGVGLASMKERAAAEGADLNIRTEPGKGTEIQIRITNGE